MQFSVLVLTAFGLSVNVLAQSEVTCGRNDYTYAEIEEAAEAACEHVQDRTTVGRNSYPHRYNNFEGFEFDGVDGPYYNFPLMENGNVYTGGAPGPDRVIINRRCELAGQITHTGSRQRNGFVDCENPISVRTERNNDSGSSSSTTTTTTSTSTSSASASTNTNDDDSAGYAASAPGILMTSVAGALMVGAFL